MSVGDQLYAPAALPPLKTHGTYCAGGCVGRRARLDGCGNVTPTGIRSPNRQARSESIPSLSRPIPY
jgi:hypothetical protein